MSPPPTEEFDGGLVPAPEPPAPRFCRDCAHAREIICDLALVCDPAFPNARRTDWICDRPRSSPISLVTGLPERPSTAIHCYTERYDPDQPDRCGIEGRYWMPKA